MQLNIEWFQDLSSLTIKLPLRRIDPAKITVVFYPTFAKINIPDRSIIKFIDFFGEIDFSKSTWNFKDNFIYLIIQKSTQGFWDSFEVQNLNKQEIKERRNTSMIFRAEWDQNQQLEFQGIKSKLLKNCKYDVIICLVC